MDSGVAAAEECGEDAVDEDDAGAFGAGHRSAGANEIASWGFAGWRISAIVVMEIRRIRSLRCLFG